MTPLLVGFSFPNYRRLTHAQASHSPLISDDLFHPMAAHIYSFSFHIPAWAASPSFPIKPHAQPTHLQQTPLPPPAKSLAPSNLSFSAPSLLFGKNSFTSPPAHFTFACNSRPSPSLVLPSTSFFSDPYPKHTKKESKVIQPLLLSRRQGQIWRISSSLSTYSQMTSSLLPAPVDKATRCLQPKLPLTSISSLASGSSQSQPLPPPLLHDIPLPSPF